MNTLADAKRSAAREKGLRKLNADLVGREIGLLEMKVITPAIPAERPFRGKLSWFKSLRLVGMPIAKAFHQLRARQPVACLRQRMGWSPRALRPD